MLNKQQLIDELKQQLLSLPPIKPSSRYNVFAWLEYWLLRLLGRKRFSKDAVDTYIGLNSPGIPDPVDIRATFFNRLINTIKLPLPLKESKHWAKANFSISAFTIGLAGLTAAIASLVILMPVMMPIFYAVIIPAIVVSIAMIALPLRLGPKNTSNLSVQLVKIRAYIIQESMNGSKDIQSSLNPGRRNTLLHANNKLLNQIPWKRQAVPYIVFLGLFADSTIMLFGYLLPIFAGTLPAAIPIFIPIILLTTLSLVVSYLVASIINTKITLSSMNKLASDPKFSPALYESPEVSASSSPNSKIRTNPSGQAENRGSHDSGQPEVPSQFKAPPQYCDSDSASDDDDPHAQVPKPAPELLPEPVFPTAAQQAQREDIQARLIQHEDDSEHGGNYQSHSVIDGSQSSADSNTKTPVLVSPSHRRDSSFIYRDNTPLTAHTADGPGLPPPPPASKNKA